MGQEYKNTKENAAAEHTSKEKEAAAIALASLASQKVEGITNTIQKELQPGIFAVMDGTVAGTGKGPRTFTPVVKNMIAASADQVAIDAVEAAPSK